MPHTVRLASKLAEVVADACLFAGVACRASLLRDPNLEIDGFVKKVRQQNFKIKNLGQV